MPNQPARPENEPPSIELKGERQGDPSCNVRRASDEGDMLGASQGDEDNRNRPKTAQDTLEQVPGHSRRRVEETSSGRAQDKLGAPEDKADTSPVSGRVEDDGEQLMKLQNTTKQVSKHSEGISQKDSPGRPGEEPEEPGGEMAIPGDAYTYQEGPRGDASDDGGSMNAPSRDTGPGGHRDEEEVSRVVKADLDHQKVVNGAGYNGTQPMDDRNEHVFDANPPSRDRGPGGRLGKRDGLGDIEDDLERQSDGECNKMGGETLQMIGSARVTEAATKEVVDEVMRTAQ